MRTITGALLVLTLLAASPLVATANELKELYDSKQYFDLRDSISKRGAIKGPDHDFYRAAVENKFNRPEAAIHILNKLFGSQTGFRDRTLEREAYTLLADSYVKTYQYGKAASTFELVLSKFSAHLSERETAGYRNVVGLWKGLSGVAPQMAVFRGDSTIQGKQEMVGLMVPVEIGGQTEHLIFDTGANLSTITESRAQELGLTIIDVPFDVGSITGGTVRARIGVAKRLKFGNVELSNVAFIVFPDKALYIEQIKYQINGIIGFPVIKALREVTITKTKQIFVPARRATLNLGNLAIDGLTPLILGVHNGRKLTFSFDTGARTSSLYPPFFRAFESEITSTGTPYTATVTGAGGSRKVNAFRMKDLSIEFGGKKPVFKTIEVFTEETTRNSAILFGNIGRDMIDQFEKMTISFASMGVRFE